MMWLWLPLVWFVVACASGLWLGAAVRMAERQESVADEVQRWLRDQRPEHLPG